MRARPSIVRPGRNRSAAALRIAVWTASAGLVWAGGCQEPVRPEARKLLVDSKHAYERGDDADVLRDTGRFLSEHHGSGEADVAFYLRGLAKFRQKDLPGAKADLRQAASRTGRKDIRLGATKALADLAFEEGDIDWAEGLYRQALEQADPRAKPTAEIRYRYGCVLQRKGRWAEADQQFDRVMHVFPGSDAAGRAAARARCLAWTVQTGVFARQDSALAEASRLREAKLPAATRPMTHEGALRFHVQVGMYETHEAARAALPSVRRLRKDALVVPTR